MAYYKSEKRITSALHDASFDMIYNPGDETPVSGIYWCRFCRYEVVSVQGSPLPPQDHPHTHNGQYGGLPVKWQLAVRARHEQRPAPEY